MNEAVPALQFIVRQGDEGRTGEQYSDKWKYRGHEITGRKIILTAHNVDKALALFIISFSASHYPRALIMIILHLIDKHDGPDRLVSGARIHDEVF